LFLGINLSHDSSAALVSPNGQIIYALAEERLSRIKNHIGIPSRAIEEILSNSHSRQVEKIIYGSHLHLTQDHLNIFLSQENGNPSNPPGRALPPYPSFQKLTGDSITNRMKIHEHLIERFPELAMSKPMFVRHHDSHVGSAIPLCSGKDSLIVSLDGSGDGESGVISLIRANESQLRTLTRISELDSIGLLYSAVTSRYNFKATHHEGKITGLAAFGQQSDLIPKLKNYASARNGSINLKYVKNKTGSNLVRLLKKFGIRVPFAFSIHDIVESVLSESNHENYADLAFACQRVLEETVCDVVRFWKDKTNVDQVVLTGGVFANVKLNQKISEIQGINSVKVFPNMGDGGIAVGAVWSHLNLQGQELNEELISSMYLGTYFEDRDTSVPMSGIKKTKISSKNLSNEIVSRIIQGRVVAILNGRMEFGPRALGNTSILLDPRDRTIVEKVNKRLRRTDFMPFAPSVLEEEFCNWFETNNQSLQPFRFMTMTCNVKNDRRELVPAITHVDGTARPQVVDKSNLYFYSILKAFQNSTGIPLLVNTSFNVHEEPIIRDIGSAFIALRSGAVDDLFVNDCHYTIG
jgi:carbamoyltransferase